MNSYAEWAERYPKAAQALTAVLTNDVAYTPVSEKSEAWAQQRVRLGVAHAGALSWRNNVGATPARCSECGAPQRPVRYGLANDSSRLNAKIKSSDLILAIPRRITPEMVGSTIAQFGSIETKKPGWVFGGTDREVAQAAWLTLVARAGGYAKFSTGEVEL